MKLVISLDLRGEDMGVLEMVEVGRILRYVPQKLRNVDWQVGEYMPLRDANGNTIGYWVVQEGTTGAAANFSSVTIKEEE